MKLYVMRHGPAEDHAASGLDEDRALTARGRDRVRGVVALLVREGEMPSRILSSGLVRADETAAIVAAAATADGWGGKVETAAELSPGGKSPQLVRRLATMSAAASVMVVGHEPDLSGLAEELLSDVLPEPMDKAMVVALDVHPEGQATLRFVVEPRTPKVVHDRRGG
jgi:phosphohistidine phosphatase